MKFLLIHNRYRFPGGEETYINNLTSLLKQHNHQIITYIKQTKPATVKGKLSIASNLLWNPVVAAEVDRLVRRERPDAALIQNIYPLIGPTVYHALRRNGVPIIQRISNYRPVCPNTHLFRNDRICEECAGKRFAYPSILHGCYNSSRLSSLAFGVTNSYHRFIKRSFDLVNTFMFPSIFIRDYLVRSGAVPAHKSIIIPTFAFPVHSLSKLPPEKSSFLYAGRLSAEKGILELVSLFKTAPLAACRLLIMGTGPLEGQVREAIRQTKNITYQGGASRKKVLAALTKAILVMPSKWYDVLPNVALESFSAGTPVVAPDRGTFSTLIKHGKNGYLYKKDADLPSLLLRLAHGPIINRTNVLQYSQAFLDPEAHYRQLIHAVYNAQSSQ